MAIDLVEITKDFSLNIIIPLLYLLRFSLNLQGEKYLFFTHFRYNHNSFILIEYLASSTVLCAEILKVCVLKFSFCNF
jgi:hypothetical protein